MYDYRCGEKLLFNTAQPAVNKSFSTGTRLTPYIIDASDTTGLQVQC